MGVLAALTGWQGTVGKRCLNRASVPFNRSMITSEALTHRTQRHRRLGALNHDQIIVLALETGRGKVRGERIMFADPPRFVQSQSPGALLSRS